MLGWLDYEDKQVLGIAPHSGRKSSMKSTVKSTWPNANNLFFTSFASQAQFNPVPKYKWFLIVLWVSIPSKIQTCRWSQTFSSNILPCNLNSPSFNSNIQLVNSNLQLVFQTFSSAIQTFFGVWVWEKRTKVCMRQYYYRHPDNIGWFCIPTSIEKVSTCNL